jgi:hypothetical protein
MRISYGRSDPDKIPEIEEKMELGILVTWTPADKPAGIELLHGGRAGWRQYVFKPGEKVRIRHPVDVEFFRDKAARNPGTWQVEDEAPD